MSAAQAYVSAVCNAIGAPIRDYPLTPDKILEALERKGKDSGAPSKRMV